MTKTVQIEGIGADEFREILAGLSRNDLPDLPDFDITTNQVCKILQISAPTVDFYVGKGLIENKASEKERPRFSFREVAEFRKKLPEIKRKRK